jgi:mannose-6-phosphate isomerase-like protein (cupin superfamily)
MSSELREATVQAERSDFSRVSTERPTQTADVARAALFSLEKLQWQPGTGAFEGVDLCEVSRDPNTGARALFLRIPRPKNVDVKPQYHYHTVTAHTYVIQGTVSTEVGGEKVTLKAGDYFRAPAFWAHADSMTEKTMGDGEPILFMMIEGPAHNKLGVYETVLAE